MVGEVGVFKGVISPARDATVPGGFGEGLTNSIKQLAAAQEDFMASEEDIKNAQASQEAALRTRQEGLDRSKMQATLVKTRAELSRSFENLRRDLPEDNAGFQAMVTEQVDQTLANLRGSLDPKLQAEFEPRFEELRQSFINTAFQTELEAGDQAYARTLSEITQIGIDEILSGEGSYLMWEQEIEDYLLNSPLDEASNVKLLDEAIKKIQVAEFTRRSVETAQQRGNDVGALPGPTHNGDVNATGMSGEARGFLNSAAGLRGSANYSTKFEFNLGPARPNKPDAQLLNVLGNTVEEVFGPGATVVVTSGKEDMGKQHGSNRHRTGLAADFYIKDSAGNKIVSTDPRAQQFMMAAAANGVMGIGYGAEYMGDSFHMDLYPHEWYNKDQGPVWGSAASAISGDLTGLMTKTEGRAYGEADNHPGGEAGRYSISSEWWSLAQQELQLPDFSAASQDRAAWWIAGQIYFQKSNGRNLQADLKSADPVRVEQARQILSEAEGVAFPQLKDVDAKTFYRMVTTSQPTQPSLVYDAEFADIPYSERVTIYNDALNNQLKNEAAAQKQADLTRKSFVENLTAMVKLNQAGLKDIMQANEDYNFTATELDKLVSELDEREQAILTGDSFANRLANTQTFFFDSGKAAERDAANAYSQQTHLEPINQLDAQSMKDRVIPDITQMGYVPVPVKQRLSQMRTSADPDVAEFAYASMAAIYDANPQAFEKAFGKDAVREARYFRHAAPFGDPGEVITSLRDMQDPNNRQRYQLADDIVDKDMKANPQRYTAAGISDKFGVQLFGQEPTPGNRAQSYAMEREYNELLRAEVAIDGDLEAAKDRALEEMKNRWQPTELGGTGYLMRRPPEHYYPEILGSRQWMDNEVRSDFGLGPDDEYRLLSDHITESEIDSGAAPSYMVTQKDDYGNWVPIMENNLPARIRFEITDDMKQADIDDFLTRAAEHRAGEDRVENVNKQMLELRREIDLIQAREGKYANMTFEQRAAEAQRLMEQLNNLEVK